MLFENEHIQKVNIYEENLDEFTAKEMRLIKYLELISKILPCFYHLLNVEQQDAFVSEIYKLPNKIAYYLFEPLETNKEELIDEMLEFVNNRGNTKTFDRQGVKNLLSKILTDMLLTIYDLSARCVSTDRTVIALDAFNFRQETCYYIQNIMMHENLRKFHPYVQRSDELYDTTKSLFAKYLLRRIFKKHCLDNNIEYKGNGQKYIDKYLDGQNIVGLRLTHVQKK